MKTLIPAVFVALFFVACGTSPAPSGGGASSAGATTGGGGAFASSGLSSSAAAGGHGGTGGASAVDAGPDGHADAGDDAAMVMDAAAGDAGSDAGIDAGPKGPTNCFKDPGVDSGCTLNHPGTDYVHHYLCPGQPPNAKDCVTDGWQPNGWCCAEGCVPLDSTVACVSKSCGQVSDGCGGLVQCTDCPGPGAAMCIPPSGCILCQLVGSCPIAGLGNTAYACQGHDPQSFCTVYNVINDWRYACCP